MTGPLQTRLPAIAHPLLDLPLPSIEELEGRCDGEAAPVVRLARAISCYRESEIDRRWRDEYAFSPHFGGAEIPPGTALTAGDVLRAVLALRPERLTGLLERLLGPRPDWPEAWDGVERQAARWRAIAERIGDRHDCCRLERLWGLRWSLYFRENAGWEIGIDLLLAAVLDELPLFGKAVVEELQRWQAEAWGEARERCAADLPGFPVSPPVYWDRHGGLAAVHQARSSGAPAAAIVGGPFSGRSALLAAWDTLHPLTVTRLSHDSPDNEAIGRLTRAFNTPDRQGVLPVAVTTPDGYRRLLAACPGLFRCPAIVVPPLTIREVVPMLVCQTVATGSPYQQARLANLFSFLSYGLDLVSLHRGAGLTCRPEWERSDQDEPWRFVPGAGRIGPPLALAGLPLAIDADFALRQAAEYLPPESRPADLSPTWWGRRLHQLAELDEAERRAFLDHPTVRRFAGSAEALETALLLDLEIGARIGGRR